MQTRICRTCKDEKPLNEFSRKLKICKQCDAKRSKEYYQKHRDEIRKRAKEDRRKNPEKYLAYNRRWYARHPERKAISGARYRDKNKAKIREYRRRYWLKNREKLQEKSTQYRLENPARVYESIKRYKKNNPEKRKCWGFLIYALLQGRIKTPPCWILYPILC